MLNDFSMVLATIATSLAIYLGLGNAEDPEMLNVMGTGEAAENEEDEKEAATAETDSTITTSTSTSKTSASTAASSVTFAKKGKKVVEDWDAGEDAMAAEEDYLKTERENSSAVGDDEEYDQLMSVYKAFKKLKTEFDEKFLLIWA